MSNNISLVRSDPDISNYKNGDVNEHTVQAYANLFYPYLVDNGGNSGIPSLTIDVTNSKELEFHDDAIDKVWTDSSRQRYNLINSQTIWGFTEASHQNKKSKSLSNAFCFGGQELTFYIATEGNSTGRIDGQWIYCKTSATVSYVNLSNGDANTIMTFDNFELSKTNSSRYTIWTVPSIDNTMFSAFGIFGIVVLKLEVTNTYYEDASLTQKLLGSFPNTNTSYLQLLVYSAAKEMIDVDGGKADVVSDTILETDTLTDIFPKTIIQNLENLNQNPLTNSQKRAIIADQAAVLFMSQHPVVLADHYPSKIIGLGIEQASSFSKILEKDLTYGYRFPEPVELFKDRLFGMLATYKAFNFTFDISEFINDKAQSNQIIKDPVKIITMNETGSVVDDFGENGVMFDPYSLSLNNVEFMEAIPNCATFTLNLYNKLIDIINISATDQNDGDLESGDSTIKINFDIALGSDKITKIRYIVSTKNNLNYETYEDLTGTELSHIFSLIKPITSDDLVEIQIDIEDVDGNTQSFYHTVFVHDATVSPVLRDLKIYQRRDGGNIVNIEYFYDAIGEVNNSFITFKYSIDGGSFTNASVLVGDYGENIMYGHRRIGWDITSDLSAVNITSEVLGQVTVTDVDNISGVGETITGALVWDLDAPEIAIRKISKIEEEYFIESSSSSSSSSEGFSSSSSSVGYSSSSSSVGFSSSSSSEGFSSASS